MGTFKNWRKNLPYKTKIIILSSALGVMFIWLITGMLTLTAESSGAMCFFLGTIPFFGFIFVLANLAKVYFVNLYKTRQTRKTANKEKSLQGNKENSKQGN